MGSEMCIRDRSTFADWSPGVSSNVYPSTLARLGFMYTGDETRDDTVVCSHCQTEVRGWTSGGDVRRKHNTCWQQFNRDNEMPSVVSDVRQRLPNSCGTERSSSTTISTNGDVLDRARNVASSTITSSHSPFYEVCEKVLCRASRKDFSDIYNNTALLPATPVPADIDRMQPDFERLAAESARLATFHDWPERAAAIVEPRELARAGMFYTGQADRVQCACLLYTSPSPRDS